MLEASRAGFILGSPRSFLPLKQPGSCRWAACFLRLFKRMRRLFQADQWVPPLRVEAAAGDEEDSSQLLWARNNLRRQNVRSASAPCDVEQSWSGFRRQSFNFQNILATILTPAVIALAPHRLQSIQVRLSTRRVRLIPLPRQISPLDRRIRYANDVDAPPAAKILGGSARSAP